MVGCAHEVLTQKSRCFAIKWRFSQINVKKKKTFFLAKIVGFEEGRLFVTIKFKLFLFIS